MSWPGHCAYGPSWPNPVIEHQIKRGMPGRGVGVAEATLLELAGKVVLDQHVDRVGDASEHLVPAQAGAGRS